MRRALLIGLPLLGVFGGGATFWFLLHRHSPVELAQDALAHGEAYKAELTLDKFLQSHPNDPAGNFEMGLVNLVKQNPVAAEQRFKRARANGYDPKAIIVPLGQAYLQQRNRFDDILTDFDPDHAPPGARAEVLTVRASAYLAAHRFGEAKAAADLASSLEPDNLQPQLAGARIAMASQQYDEAAARVDRILAHDPAMADALLLKAEIAMHKSDPAAALALAQKVIDAQPLRPDAKMAAARALAALHRDIEAEKLVDAVLVRNKRDSGANYLKLILSSRAHDYAAADEALGELSGVIDQLPLGYYFLAITKLGRNEPAAAEEAAIKFAARNPTDVAAAKLLAFTELAARKPQQALEVLKKLADSGHKDADTLDLTGRAEAMMGNMKSAQADLSQASALAPNNTEILNRLAAANLGIGQAGAAEADLRESLEKSPNQPVAAKTLVAAALAAGDFAGAEHTIADLRKAVGDTEDVGIMEAQLHVAQLDLAGAEAQYQDLLKRFPDSRAVTFGLIQAEGRLGNSKTAQQRLDGWMAAHPHDRGGLQLQVQAQTRAGNMAGAITAAEAAHAAAPDDADITALLASLYVSANTPDRAVSLLDRAGAATNPAIGALRGLALIRAKHPAEARAQLSAVLATAPANMQARMALAELDLADKNFEGARGLVRDALQQVPGNPRLLQALVAIDMKDGGEAAALATAEVLQQDPKNLPAALMLPGSIYEMGNKLPKAADAYLAAYHRQPMPATLVAAATALGRANRQAERTALLSAWLDTHKDDVVALQFAASDALVARRMDDAAARLAQILALQPNNPVALNNMAWVKISAHDLPAALHLAQRAYYLQPGPETEDTLGWVLHNQGQAANALPLLYEAATATPTDSILYHYAASLHANGHNEDARAAIARALKDGKPFTESEDARALQKQLGG